MPRGVGIAGRVAVIARERSATAWSRAATSPTSSTALKDARDAAANAAGFRIASVALAGQQQISREEILAAAGVTGRTSLLFLDVDAARARLKTNPWIADATVLKLYPGPTCRSRITEREAFALWQKDGKRRR